jgi:hypothetical protein
MTPSGIEPATFRSVTQYLNHCATVSGPHVLHVCYVKVYVFYVSCVYFILYMKGHTK